ncbi:MAG TPA: DUF2905 domain-containing protein [Puia sp.]|jgi:uncharacterized membrane protein|nr:DUF2905 domain-containing protein [Puia sp.]
MGKNLGLYILILGVIFVVAGLIIYFFHDKLGWIGRLPGDIRVERPGFRLYIPVVTMLAVSVVLSLVLWLIRKIG